MQLRKATADDRGFLLNMLVEACNWAGEQRVAQRDVEAHPHLKNYVAAWPRERDFGRVAVDDNELPVGAAWARTFSAQHPGYGFVAEDVPELTMAVVASHRGLGIGHRLLGALIADARKEDWPALSLSVEDGNRAMLLYRTAGFITVGRVDNSDTMLLELRS